MDYATDINSDKNERGTARTGTGDMKSKTLKCFQVNSLNLNNEKTSVTIYSLMEINLCDNVKNIKYLCAVLEPTLSWATLINYIANKISKNVFLIRKLKSY